MVVIKINIAVQMCVCVCVCVCAHGYVGGGVVKELIPHLL